MMRFALLLLGCLLVFDVATPLLPGAFRFAPEESVEAWHAPERPRVRAAMPRVRPILAGPTIRPALAHTVRERPHRSPPRADARRNALGTRAAADGPALDDD
jgi:hypothetical protein